MYSKGLKIRLNAIQHVFKKLIVQQTSEPAKIILVSHFRGIEA